MKKVKDERGRWDDERQGSGKREWGGALGEKGRGQQTLRDTQETRRDLG